MKKKTTINIGLHLENGQIIDLQIPNQIKLVRLKKILQEALTYLAIQLPESFELLILNKPIHLEENDWLSDFPLANGDQLRVKKLVDDNEEDI